MSSCPARLMGIACEHHDVDTPFPEFTHSGKTTTADGGELLVTWTYLPPRRPRS